MDCLAIDCVFVWVDDDGRVRSIEIEISVNNVPLY